MGFEVINARTIISPSEFEIKYICRDDQGEVDWIHGNSDYYLRIATLIQNSFFSPDAHATLVAT